MLYSSLFIGFIVILLTCIAHLSAEDMLKSAVLRKGSLKILNLSDLDQGQ